MRKMVCSKCGEEKELDEFLKSGKMCLECNRSYHKEWREKNKESLTEYQRSYYLENKEHIDERTKAWREENPEKVKEYRQGSNKRQYWKNREESLKRVEAWREENPEKVKEYSARYYAENQEELKDKSLRYARENPDKVSDRHRRWYESGGNETKKAYRKANTYKYVEYAQTRRARKLGHPESSPYSVIDVYERASYKCYMCGESEDLSIDHLIPISKGGPDNYQNVSVLCRSCNSKKSHSLPHEISDQELRKSVESEIERIKDEKIS